MSPSERRACATRSSCLQRLLATPSSTPGARPRTGSDFGGDLDAIATAQRECNTGAVYAFKMQRRRRIFVRTKDFVAKMQLTARSIKTRGKPRRAWPTVPKVGRRLFVQSRRLFVLRQQNALTPGSASRRIHWSKPAWSKARTVRPSLGLKAVSSLAPRGRGMLIGAKNRGADSFMNQHLTHDLRPESYEVTDLLRSI